MVYSGGDDISRERGVDQFYSCCRHFPIFRRFNVLYVCDFIQLVACHVALSHAVLIHAVVHGGVVLLV